MKGTTNGKKVLFGGAFDLLHYAHVLAMAEAATYGDILVINVLSDERVREKKGDTRPIIPASERVEIIKALEMVDEVVCLAGDADYPFFKLLEIVKPDVIVINGDEFSDYSEEEKACAEAGIELVKCSRIKAPSGLDTTKIVSKIRNS